MNNFFFTKLAVSNIKKNSPIYVPYIVTCVITFAMFYIICFLSLNESMKDIYAAGYAMSLFNMGRYVAVIFSVIFLFYTNSFILKRRKKEIGLFNILGLGKPHIALVLFIETLITFVTTICLGFILGSVFCKLIFFIILKMLHMNIALRYIFSFKPLLMSCTVFSVIFALILIFNLFNISVSNPIQLLKGSSTGEKEPKTKLISTILGLIFLGIGYVFSLTASSGLSVIIFFFPVVLSVVIGTYLLFTAGSITLLKSLKKNKNFYYQTKNFTSVSGLLYRMKQNAAGLANICILSTMVLFMISTTASLYIGSEDALHTNYPYDISIDITNAPFDSLGDTASIISREAQEDGKILADADTLHLLYSHSDSDKQVISAENLKERSFVLCISIGDYNRIMKKSETLNDGEVLLYEKHHHLKENSFMLADKSFSVKKFINEYPLLSLSTGTVITSFYVVLSESDFMRIAEFSVDGKTPSFTKNYFAGINLSDASPEEKMSFSRRLYSTLEPLKNNGAGLKIVARDAERGSLYEMYGSFLFLGIFLGALFLMATVLIMYYKQITEGFEDKDRFLIMKKVGMSDNEVKTSINRQVIMVFFLPIGAAVVHIAFAFRLMTLLLEALYLVNIGLFLTTTIITIAVFFGIYTLVYIRTAKTYYKIVHAA
ncbi:MAG TPA: hypothetical protein PLU33_09125 [Treponemataceae bacterium]|nr:hypothetical protein [Treponemataceae bacterium]HQL05292.1 hypothetical protein [Treponemataceae bacterium]